MASPTNGTASGPLPCFPGPKFCRGLPLICLFKSDTQKAGKRLCPENQGWGPLLFVAILTAVSLPSSGHISAVELNPVLLPLSWLLGTWESDEPGEGTYPSIKPFRYTEKLHFSHVGQPVINFMFNAFHAESNKPLHRECGFIRIQQGTNRVAFVIAQNSGLVEIEEGELTGNRLTLQTQSLGRISFAKEPHVQQICRVLQLRPDGKLEQTVSMATDNQSLTQHLHIIYSRSS